MEGDPHHLSSFVSVGEDADLVIPDALKSLNDFICTAHKPEEGTTADGPVRHDADAVDYGEISDSDLADVGEDVEPTIAEQADGGNDTSLQELLQAGAPVQAVPEQAQTSVIGTSNAMSTLPHSQVFQHHRQQATQQLSEMSLPRQPEQNLEMPQSFTEMLGSVPLAETAAPPQPQLGVASATHAVPIVQFGQPGAVYSPVIPPELLYDPTQPAQASQHTVYTLGPVTLDQDEFAASIVSQQMGVELAEQELARLYVEPISFTETFFGAGGYPRLRETARAPGLRRKQVGSTADVPEPVGKPDPGMRLTRSGQLRPLDGDATLQWEHDVLDLSAVHEAPTDAKPGGTAKYKSKAASVASMEGTAPQRLQVQQAVVHASAPLSEDVLEVEDLWQQTLAEEDEGIALCCLAAVPDWEDDIEWGSDSSEAQSAHGAQCGAAAPQAGAPTAACEAEPIEWESDSDTSVRTDERRPAKVGLLGPERTHQASHACAEQYGWDNARPEVSRALPRRKDRSQVGSPSKGTAGLDLGAESESADVTVDALSTGAAEEPKLAVAATTVLPGLGGERSRADQDREMLLDAGLWAPGVYHGAVMPSYLGLLPKKAPLADVAEDDAGAKQPTDGDADAKQPAEGDSGRVQPPSVALTAESEAMLCDAHKVDQSGLVPSFDGPESKLATKGSVQAASISRLARSGLVVLNANDASMTFEALPNLPDSAKAEVNRAAAEVVAPPAPPEKDADAARLAAAHEDRVAREFAAFNVSNDAKYRKTRVGRLADIAVRTGLLHAPIATNLSQLPLPNTLTREELLRPHHPQNAWWIQLKALAGEAGQIRVIFQSLAGLSRQVDLPANSAGEVTVRQLWEMVESVFLPDGPMAGELSLFKPINPSKFEELDISGAMDRSLVDVGLMEPVNQVVVRSRQVQLLPAPRALSTLPSQPTVLQALYGTRKKLTATQWHVYGVEHMLPRAFVLNHPGMGATLQTFFRRPVPDASKRRAMTAVESAAVAERLAELTAMAEGPAAWRVGQVTPLGSQDASPFRIGDVPPGVPLLTLENGSSVAVAAPHDAGRNYLLVRRPSGQMLLRKFTGCFLVGQQQPKIPVMQPASQTCREVEDSRLVAWVHRTLRRKQNKLARENSGEERPSVSMKELVERFAPPCLSQFSGLDVNLTEGAIAAILQSRCHLVPSMTNPDEYVLPEGARIHTEDELCTMIGPDSVCALESMRSGLVRLDATGLRRHEELAKCPLDKLALLAHMLPRRLENRQAALVAVTTAVSAPWVLTENFINCTKKDTQKMFLCISGLGDPSGRGLAMSYVKDMKRLGKDPVNRMLSKQEAPSITGTVSDLRKLPHKQVGEMLVKEFNVPAETVETLDRWERIGVLRELSNKACVAGQANELGPRYARNVKVSMEEMRKKQSEAACTVLKRQHEFLTAGKLPDMTAPDTLKAAVGDVHQGLDEQSLQVLEIKGGGAEDEPGVHGAMRVRRRITYAKPGRGQPVTRTVFFTTRTDIFNVNSLCEKWDQRNEKLGIVGGTLARTMDGVRKQLTIVCAKKGNGEVERRTFRFKSRKPTVRTRAPAARPATVPRMSVRAPGAATKAELRKQKQEEAAELAAAQPKAARPKGDGKGKSKSKPKPKDAPKAAKKKREKDEEATEDDDMPDLSDAEADPAGLAVVDERDPEFVEYQDQYDESNSDVPDGGSDSDYNSIDSGAESEDKDFKAAAQRELRAQQRAKAGPATGSTAATGGGRRQKRAPKAGPNESEFDEEEMGQLDDLIDDGELEEAQLTESEDDFSSGGDEETEDEFEEGGRARAAKRAPRKPIKKAPVALDDDDDSMEVLATPAKRQRATAHAAPPSTETPAAPAAAHVAKPRVKIKRQSGGGGKKSAPAVAARPRPVKRSRADSESTESDDNVGDELSSDSDTQQPAASGRAKRRTVTADSPPPDDSPVAAAVQPFVAAVPVELSAEAAAHAEQELQRRMRAPDLRSAAIRDLSTMFTSALNEAFASSTDFQLVQSVFKTAPSSATIPDYYDYVDRKDVITWTSLKKRQHTSRRALLEDIARMADNANKYNQGGLLRNPAHVPGGSEPETIRRSPGKFALPQLPALMDAFRKRVTDLLYGRYRTKAEKHELNILGAYLVTMEYDQGANVLWVECEACQRWRIVSRTTFDRVQDDRFTCDDVSDRPVRGCSEGPNANDDEELLRIAKQDLMPVQ